MEISALPRIQAEHVPLERLAESSQLSEREKITELSRQFEALLLRQVLHQGQKTIIRSDLIPESTATEIYRDLFTHQLAESISRSRSFGLAQSLEQELTRQLSSRQPDKGGQGED
jgi:Rod binding domain-containing protein